MKMVSIKQAKDQLTALARAVEAGERIVITRNGEPVVDLVPHRKQGGLDFEGLERWKKEKGIDRIFGNMSDDFDDPLPEDFLLRPLP
jgi:prevent-host-death family protein